MKSPTDDRKLTTFMAIPLVSVGRMMEHAGSLRLKNGHGSGMMRLGRNSSPPNGGEFRSGKDDRDVSHEICCGEGRSVAGVVGTRFESALFRWGPMLMRIRRTSTIVLTSTK
jgi:hypothetical protein